MVLEVGKALAEGREPSAEARLFVAASLLELIRTGNRDPFRLAPPRGSHRTIPRLIDDEGEVEDYPG